MVGLGTSAGFGKAISSVDPKAASTKATSVKKLKKAGSAAAIKKAAEPAEPATLSKAGSTSAIKKVAEPVTLSKTAAEALSKTVSEPMLTTAAAKAGATKPKKLGDAAAAAKILIAGGRAKKKRKARVAPEPPPITAATAAATFTGLSGQDIPITGPVHVTCSDALKKRLVPAATASLHKLLQSSGGGKAKGGVKTKPSAATLLAISNMFNDEFFIADGILDFEELDEQYSISNGLKKYEWTCYLASKDDPQLRIEPDDGGLTRVMRKDPDCFDDDDAEEEEFVVGTFSGLRLLGADGKPMTYVLNVVEDKTRPRGTGPPSPTQAASPTQVVDSVAAPASPET